MKLCRSFLRRTSSETRLRRVPADYFANLSLGNSLLRATPLCPVFSIPTSSGLRSLTFTTIYIPDCHLAITAKIAAASASRLL